jgi:uncharacterized protein (TIGR00252 family)
MSTTTTGRRAETAAANYLERQGYHVTARNWRTRWCEIDLVATKADTVILVEVKYRRRSLWGSGLDYITTTKYKQMSFAAEFWLATHEWTGLCHLAAIEVSGPQYEVTAFIPEA